MREKYLLWKVLGSTVSFKAIGPLSLNEQLLKVLNNHSTSTGIYFNYQNLVFLLQFEPKIHAVLPNVKRTKQGHNQRRNQRQRLRQKLIRKTHKPTEFNKEDHCLITNVITTSNSSFCSRLLISSGNLFTTDEDIPKSIGCLVPFSLWSSRWPMKIDSPDLCFLLVVLFSEDY